MFFYVNLGGGNGSDNEQMEMQLLRNRESDRPIILNVGGKKYEVTVLCFCNMKTITLNATK